MNLGTETSSIARKMAIIGAAFALGLSAQTGYAQAENTTQSIPNNAANAGVQAQPSAGNNPAAAGDPVADSDPSTFVGSEEAGELPSYEPLGPEMIKGAPTDRGVDVQEQFSDDGETAVRLHQILVWVMGLISVFVLGLLIWVLVRYNRRANPEASNVSHNVKLEIVWTFVPLVILALIAVPSISLLAKQYRSPPENAITVKAIGSQWLWTYAYPDHGEFEVVSNMMPVADAKAKGLPALLEVDNRMVVPAGVPIRLQTTATDVIHSFAVPSLWFKLDAVPGRLNERTLLIKEPGIYYGQCSELCGIRHGYMPIAIEAVPLAKFERWVKSQGGKLPREIEAEEAAAKLKAAQEAAAAAAKADAEEEAKAEGDGAAGEGDSAEAGASEAEAPGEAEGA